MTWRQRPQGLTGVVPVALPSASIAPPITPIATISRSRPAAEAVAIATVSAQSDRP